MSGDLQRCQRDHGIHIGKYERYDFFQYGNLEEVLQYWKMLRPAESCSPFQNSAWADAIVSGEYRHAKLNDSIQMRYLFVVGFVNQKPVVILPFSIQGGLLGDRLVWLGGKISDYNGIAIDQDHDADITGIVFNKILEMVYDSNPDIHAAILTRNLDGASYASQRNNASARDLSAEYSAHALTLQKDWNGLFNAIRSSKSRQRLRSKNRMLRKEGRVKFARVRGAVKCRIAAAQILDWKIDQLNNNGSPGPFGTSSQPSPLRLTIENAISQGDKPLQVFGLFLDGKLVAGMLAFVTKDCFYYYVSSYSTNVAKSYSVGTLLLVKTLELAARYGLKRYDFLIGDETYKSDWCDTRIPLVHITKAFDHQGLLICSGFQLLLAVKKLLLRYPKIIVSTKKTSTHLQSLITNSKSRQNERLEVSDPEGNWDKVKERT